MLVEKFNLRIQETGVRSQKSEVICINRTGIQVNVLCPKSFLK